MGVCGYQPLAESKGAYREV